MQIFKSSSASCFRYFMIIKFSKFCKKIKCSVVIDLPAGSCIYTRTKLIKAKAISPLAFFFLNSFLMLKLNSKAAQRSCSLKKAIPKTFGIFTGKQLCWSLFLKKLQDLRWIFSAKRLPRRCFTWF